MINYLKMQSPLVHAISGIPFDALAHLTFKNPLPNGREVNALVGRFLRKAARMSHTHFERLDYVGRGEFGELGGRFHEHILLGNLGPISQLTSYLIELKDFWSAARLDVGSFVGKVGDICQVWPYDSTLDGVDYVMKGLERYEFASEARNYELTKFGLTDQITVSDSLIKYVGQHERRHCSATVKTLKQGETAGFEADNLWQPLHDERVREGSGLNASALGFRTYPERADKTDSLMTLSGRAF
jgi:hypothetical protein